MYVNVVATEITNSFVRVYEPSYSFTICGQMSDKLEMRLKV